MTRGADYRVRNIVSNGSQGRLRIWGRANSVNVQKVLWCLRELDLAYERIDAGMAFGRNRDPERTPMPWTSDGGFTDGSPWLPYGDLNRNVERQGQVVTVVGHFAQLLGGKPVKARSLHDF
jgi:hypothetical protein